MIKGQEIGVIPKKTGSGTAPDIARGGAIRLNDQRSCEAWKPHLRSLIQVREVHPASAVFLS
jgi:hypothetical protein